MHRGGLFIWTGLSNRFYAVARDGAALNESDGGASNWARLP